jgi:hypothetical protein
MIFSIKIFFFYFVKLKEIAEEMEQEIDKYMSHSLAKWVKEKIIPDLSSKQKKELLAEEQQFFEKNSDNVSNWTYASEFSYQGKFKVTTTEVEGKLDHT